MKVDQTREAVTMKVAEKRRWKILVVAGATMALVAGMVSTLPSAYAGGTIKANDDQWISIGMGIRTKLSAVEHGQANGQGYGTNFGVDNARVYINGKIHKYVGFTFNTECFNCAVGGGGTQFAGNSNMGLIDAIGKFEFNELVNLWVGRTLVPGERGELNGPFYHAVYEGFKTPFNSADFSGNFGTGGAGVYGRDNGAVLWGSVLDHHLSYAASVFTGLRSSAGFGPNGHSSLLYAGRVTYNFFNKEDNPGYYTSGTYYGTAGHILAIAGGINYQARGAGSSLAASDMTVLVSDILWELPLGKDMQGGVITVNGEFKHYAAGYDTTVAFANNGPAGLGDCFCMFRGQSYTAYALYLFPGEIGIGRFQPYARFTTIHADQSSNREETEFGTNYIISGHNARISAFYQYGDLATKSLFNWAPTAAGQEVSAFKLALQLQY
ncbi:MAG: hypothetical protein ABIQ24_13370 [Nitrospiraceae bacterium]